MGRCERCTTRAAFLTRATQPAALQCKTTNSSAVRRCPRAPTFVGGIYQLRLQFPDQYPEKAPRVRFVTEMFHPNIFPDGTLCLDIIQDKWKPIYTVGSILTSVQVRRDARLTRTACELLACLWHTLVEFLTRCVGVVLCLCNVCNIIII